MVGLKEMVVCVKIAFFVVTVVVSAKDHSGIIVFRVVNVFDPGLARINRPCSRSLNCRSQRRQSR